MNEIYKQLPEEVRKALKKVTEQEILMQRLRGEEGIILKIGTDCYFLSAKEKIVKIKYVLGQHLCGKCRIYRKTLCKKIYDSPIEELKSDKLQKGEATIKSKRIEKYPFITKGIECFNCSKDFFVVAECTNFEPFRGNFNYHTGKDELEKMRK